MHDESTIIDNSGKNIIVQTRYFAFALSQSFLPFYDGRK